MRPQYERVPVDQLKFDPKNSRKHDTKNIKAIKESLLKFGQQKPIVVMADGTVIAGNGTLQAFKELLKETGQQEMWSTIDVHWSALKKSEAKNALEAKITLRPVSNRKRAVQVRPQRSKNDYLKIKPCYIAINLGSNYGKSKRATSRS